MDSAQPIYTPVNIENVASYKVCILNKDGNPARVIVFGENSANVFSELENLTYQANSTQISYSKQQIHRDDSIRMIKKKLVLELGKNEIAYDELYLFANRAESMNVAEAYKTITDNDNNIFDKKMAGQLLMNLQVLEKDKVESWILPTYSFADFEREFGEDVERTVPISIGQKFSKARNLLFSANPYFVLPASPLAYSPSRENPLYTFENDLLLNYGDFKDQTIYVCLANHVLDFAAKEGIDESFMVPTYFPLLEKAGIRSLANLLENHQKLIAETQALLDDKTLVFFDKVDTFYNIYRSRTRDLVYLERGIKAFELVIHPAEKTTLPLELIFKQIHATRQIPFIKYHPGIRREPYYRLFSTSRTKRGKKIPFLSKAQILALSKRTGRPRQISMFVPHVEDRELMNFYLDFENHGNIVVHAEFKRAVGADVLEQLILTTINPVIASINHFFKTAGYELQTFRGFKDAAVEFTNLEYFCSMDMRTLPNLQKYAGGLAVAFDILDADLNKGAILQFKRVENYRKMDAIASMITQIMKRTNNERAVVQALITNLALTEEEAIGHVTRFFSDHIRVQGKFVNKSVDLVDKPGFPVLIQKSPFENRIFIDVKEILSIEYLDVLHVYLDSFLRVHSAPDSYGIEEERVRALFSKVVKPIEDISHETNILIPEMAELASVEDEEEEDEGGIVFEDEEGDEDIGGILFEEEDESEAGELGQEEDLDKEEEEADDDQGILFEDEESPEQEEILQRGGSVFFNRMQELEPTLFLSKKVGKYDAYPRACPANTSRQPVILTDEEKQELDPSSYEVAMPYSTKADKKYWYICPRYWCLQTNKPMTQEQVSAGECGGKVIPQSKKNNPPPGHFIYEFTDDREHKDKDGNYRQHRPGFLPEDSHPSHCLPCCFKKMNANQQITRREQCGVRDEDLAGDPETVENLVGNENKVEGKKGQEKRKNQAYVVGFDKYPIAPKRWGFLPLSVELFLHTDNSTSTVKNNPALIRPTETPLLRFGVENSSKKSFLACLADLYSYYHSGGSVLSITEFAEKFASALTLDMFIRAQNGNLVSVFQSHKYSITDVEAERYSTTEFYKGFKDLSNPAQNHFLKDTIASFENFLKYLRDPDSFVDHTYLWDLMRSGDTGLFGGPLNLVLLEIMDNDITDNVSVLCPTGSAGSIYNASLGTLILLKHAEFYEPVYQYSSKTPVKVFQPKNTPPELVKVLEMIRRTASQYCRPRVHTVEEGVNAATIRPILESHQYLVFAQVLNYRGKGIAFLVKQRPEDSDTSAIYVPTYPSARIAGLRGIYMDDVTWLSYEKTRDGLISMDAKTEGQIKCRPQLKRVEDGMIVGLFTETNQFIPTDPPIQDIVEDGLEASRGASSYGSGGYVNADIKLATSTGKDEIRTTTIQNISLESNFYVAFRSKIRVLLNDYANKVVRDSIVAVLDDPRYIYQNKLRTIQTKLIELAADEISFDDLAQDVLTSLRQTTSFSTIRDNAPFCLTRGETLCLPRKNLLSGEPNSILYFERIADELLRYKRIRLFLLEPKKYLNITHVDYKVNDDEIIVLQSILYGDYFDDMIPFTMNSYVQQVTFDEANPAKMTKYKNNEISLEQQSAVAVDMRTLSQECVVKTATLGPGSGFRTQVKETELHGSPECSFYPLLFATKTTSVVAIKAKLWLAYRALFVGKDERFMGKVYAILKDQGKGKLVDGLVRKSYDFETMILDDSYSLSALDVFVLTPVLDIPMVLLLANGAFVLGTADRYLVIRIGAEGIRFITPMLALSDLDQAPVARTAEDYILGYKLKIVRRVPEPSQPQ